MPFYSGGAAATAPAPPTAPTRATAVLTVPDVAPGGVGTGSVALAPTYRLLRLQTSVPARVRVYTSPAARDADLTRPPTAAPPPNSGLMLDYITDSATTMLLSPVVTGVCMPSGVTAAMAVDNPGTVTRSITTTLLWEKA